MIRLRSNVYVLKFVATRGEMWKLTTMSNFRNESFHWSKIAGKKEFKVQLCYTIRKPVFDNLDQNLNLKHHRRVFRSLV